MSAYASFTRRSLARFVDLCVILAPCGLLYLLDRLLGFPVRYMSLFNYQRPESVMMFMTYDFPGVFITFSSIKLSLAYPISHLWRAADGRGRWASCRWGSKSRTPLVTKSPSAAQRPVTFLKSSRQCSSCLGMSFLYPTGDRPGTTSCLEPWS